MRRVFFSGDVGRERELLIRPPAVPEIDADYVMLCESTYGDRLHPSDDFGERLAKIVESTAARGGSVVIPAFAVGRTQELLYAFRELSRADACVDSRFMSTAPWRSTVRIVPLVITRTTTWKWKVWRRGSEAFRRSGVHFDRAVADSKALNAVGDPMIIISASGMATGGRVMHHLERCLPDARNTILFAGFQAPGTLGHTLQSGASMVRIHKEQVPVRAHIESIENLSGHADYGEILRWLARFPRAPQKVWLVHGEPSGAQSLRDKIAGSVSAWGCRCGAVSAKDHVVVPGGAAGCGSVTGSTPNSPAIARSLRCRTRCAHRAERRARQRRG